MHNQRDKTCKHKLFKHFSKEISLSFDHKIWLFLTFRTRLKMIFHNIICTTIIEM